VGLNDYFAELRSQTLMMESLSNIKRFIFSFLVMVLQWKA